MSTSKKPTVKKPIVYDSAIQEIEAILGFSISGNALSEVLNKPCATITSVFKVPFSPEDCGVLQGMFVSVVIECLAEKKLDGEVGIRIKYQYKHPFGSNGYDRDFFIHPTGELHKSN